MLQLLKIWSFSHYRNLKANTFLTLFGIAFGVAIFIAIQIANQNIRDSFQWTIQQIAGKGEIAVKGTDAGFAEEEIIRARAVPGVKKVLPLTVQSVGLEHKNIKEEIVILGLDLVEDPLIQNNLQDQNGTDSFSEFIKLLEPSSIIISSNLSERFDLKVGSRLILKIGTREVETNVGGIIKIRNDLPPPYGGNFAIMDIAASQLLFHKVGILDRMNIVSEENSSTEQLKKALESAFPGLFIFSPDDEKRVVDGLLQSFNMNIKTISEVSILVGMFLIYNTLSLLVVRRKVELGILSSIGLSGRELFLIIMIEAFILGLIGSVMGIGLGIMISRTVLKAISLTITSLYLKVYTESISFTFGIGISGLVIGLGASLLAAAFPAWTASQALPRDNINRSSEIKPPYRHAVFLMMAVFLFMISYYLAKLPSYGDIPLFGYLSALFLLGGMSLTIPSTLSIFYSGLRLSYLKGRFNLLKVAGSIFFQQSARNQIGIAALMISVALLISVTLMIHSFRKTLVLWFDQTIKADLIVESKEWLNPGNLALISPEKAEPIKHIKGVVAVDLFREDRMFFHNKPFILNTRSLLVHLEQSRYQFTNGSPSQKLREVIDHGEVLISESFSLQHHLKEGDSFTLNTPSGEIPFKIGAVFYDYTTQGGKVVIDRSLYLKYWKDDRLSLLAIYLQKEALDQGEREEIRSRLISSLGDNGLIVISNQEIRTKVMGIFEQTFSITRVLEWITILISLLGVVNMLLANHLDQKREIGILRSIGASRNQISFLTLFESLWMAIVANGLGGLGGTVLSLILVYVINRQSFFWTIQFDFSGWIFLRIFLIVSGAVLLAAFFPARIAAQGSIREAINYE